MFEYNKRRGVYPDIMSTIIWQIHQSKGFTVSLLKLILWRELATFDLSYSERLVDGTEYCYLCISLRSKTNQSEEIRLVMASLSLSGIDEL